jgi:DNA topoisomerase-1
MDVITLEQALTMFSLPRKVGKTEDGQEILANLGRFGPYIKIDKTFVSIKPLDPFGISETEARGLYSKKLETEAKKNIKKFKNTKIQILRGPYGPYVTDGTKNARIPKGMEPASLDLDKAKEILDKSKPRKYRPKRKK